MNGLRLRARIAGALVSAALMLVLLLTADAASAVDPVPALLAELDLVPIRGQQRAPRFELMALDGSRVALASFRGQVVLLYLWASWCPYCTQELPAAIEQVHRQWGAQRVAVLAVNIQESRDKVTAWVKEKRVTSRVLLDPDGAVVGAYKVTATPTAFLIGRDGRLVAKGVGVRPWADETSQRLFKALLAAPPA